VSDIAYRYTGKDPMQAHHGGIPARDLTDEDVKALDADLRKTLRASPIYEKVEDASKAAPAKEDAPKKADEKR
jgi:hypothetical protein